MVRWENIEREPKGLLVIMTYVRKHGVIHGARKRYVIAGLPLFYDKVWFTGYKDLAKHRLSGKDWDATIGLWKDGAPSGGPFGNIGKTVVFDGAMHRFERTTIQNPDNMRRDLTLLRMFGSEELFSESK